MPVVFAQPAPAGAFRQIADQGNPQAFLQAYTALSGQLQNRYADDARTSAQERLGYANLAADTALRQRALGIHESEVQLRPMMQAAAIEQRARLELDQWMAQQQFTARDQQELNRQRNSLGELINKRESGEITESEFYQMASRVAPRVNSLQQRENFTRQKALNEQRQMQTQLFETQKNQREALLAFNQAELDGKLDYHIPPRYATRLAEIMRDAHPELRAGTPEYDAMSKAEADERGWAERYAKKADGTPVYEKDIKGQGEDGTTTSGGKKMNERDRAAIAQRALNDTIKKFESEGKMDYSQEELLAAAQKRIEAITALSGGGTPKEKAELGKQRDLQVSRLEMAISKAIESTEAPPHAKQFVVSKLSEAKRLMEKYDPDEMPKSIRKQIESLISQANTYNLYPREEAEKKRVAAASNAPAVEEPSRLAEMFSPTGAPVEGGALGGMMRQFRRQ